MIINRGNKLSIFNKKDTDKIQYPYWIDINNIHDVSEKLKNHKVCVSMMPPVFDFGVPVKYGQIQQILNETYKRGGMQLRACVLSKGLAYLQLDYVSVVDEHVLDG